MNRAGSRGEERFAAFVLVAAAAVSTLGGVFVLLGGAQPGTTVRRALIGGGLVFLGLSLLAARRLRPALRVSLAMILVSCVAAAYSGEVFLRWSTARQVQHAAHRLGIAYDDRTRFELVRDLRREGKDAWPAAFPGAFLAEDAFSELLPLGGVSRVPTVACNEMGPYLVYESDEHGFHNPTGIWTSDHVQVVAVGDSFAYGSCVPSGQNAVDRIRESYPGTLNLGATRNGPLVELAGLREYLVALRPRIVLWFYYEGNDLPLDLMREAAHPLLRRYLETGFRQNLPERQGEIDVLLRRRLGAAFDRLESDSPRDRSGDWWAGLLRLRSLRQSVGFQVTAPRIDYSGIDYDLFRSILAEAGRATSAWGGRLYFVYIPFGQRYRQDDIRRRNDEVRDRVLRILSDLNLPVIDLVPVLAGQDDLSVLYPFPGAHFSPAAYRLMGDTIVEALRAAGESRGGGIQSKRPDVSAPAASAATCVHEGAPADSPG